MKKGLILFIVIFFNAAHAQNKQQNHYCDKYKTFFDFIFRTSEKWNACLAGQIAYEHHNPKFCQDLSVASGKRNEVVFQACQDGFKNPKVIGTEVSDATINKDTKTHGAQETKKEVQENTANK